MSLEFKLKKALDSNDEQKIHNVFNEIYCQYGKLIYFIAIKDIENKQNSCHPLSPSFHKRKRIFTLNNVRRT